MTRTPLRPPPGRSSISRHSQRSSRRRRSRCERWKPAGSRSIKKSRRFCSDGAAPIAPASPFDTCSITHPACRRTRVCGNAHAGRRAYLDAIAELPLERAPGAASVYSDPGFMLLGFALEAARPARRSTKQFSAHRQRDRRARSRLSARPPSSCADIAPTETIPGAVACSAAKCTTKTRPRSAASPRMPASSDRWTPSATSRGSCSTTFDRPTLLGTPALMRTFADAIDRARQLARARMGHDAADLVVRHAPVAARDRSHRVHRHVAVDRS